MLSNDSLNIHVICITQTIKSTFKHIKKLINYFFIICLPYIKIKSFERRKR